MTGPPSSRAELILPILSFRNAARVLKEIRRIQCVVAEEFPGRAMELIRSGFDRGIQNGARRPARFGTVVIGLHLEFLNGIDGRPHHVGRSIQEIHQVDVVIDSVQQVVVLRGP